MIIRSDTAGEAYFDTPGKTAKHGVAPPAIGVPAALRAAQRIPAQPMADVRELTPLRMATACPEPPLHSAASEAEVCYGE